MLLCGGIFVMAATLLRCILSLKDINSINNSTVWAIRETVRICSPTTRSSMKKQDQLTKT